ncbi:MAG TPA: AsmA family protein, partial [Bacteroidia bacterium]|nr:AsmA family protein [Bacteroidia bacterium]
MKRILKFLGILLLLIVIGITLIFFFKNSIAKYMVEKYCVEWTGRKITLGGIKINTKRGSIYLKDLKIYEANGDTVFFDCHDIYLRVKLGKLFDKVYEVEKIQIDNPEIRITQNDSTFNFDDLIKRFSSGKKTDTAKTPDTHYYIDSVYINNANVTYNNVPIHNVFRIHEMNLRVPKLDWDKPESKLHLDFNYGIGGAFNINLDVNRKTFAYTLLLVINNYDLSQYYTPLNTLVKVSSLKGILSTDLRIYGKFDSPEDFALAGFFRISDFELRDMEKRKLCGLHLLSLRIDTVNIKKHLIDIPITLIDKPYMAFDVYSKGNNMTEMVKE